MSAIKSVLKAGIDALGDDVAIKGKSLPNALKKLQVKDEEVKFSGILDNVEPEAKYSKAQLQELVAGRKDEFGFESGEGEYNWVSLPEGVDNPTYKENIYTFKQTDQAAETRYSSNHFSEVPNYLMHTRTYDTDMDGKPTRVLQEIQSDLHQTGRQDGYGEANGTAPSLADTQDLLDELSDAERAVYVPESFGPNEEALEQLDLIKQRMEELGLNHQYLDDNSDVTAEELIENSVVGRPPVSPYEKSWLAKGIEREIDGMLSAGKTQLAIPIKGGDIQRQLHRAEGPQKFYETQVLATAKKLAKQNDMDFELITKKGELDTSSIPDKVADDVLLELTNAGDEFIQSQPLDGLSLLDVMDNFSDELDIGIEVATDRAIGKLVDSGTRVSGAQRIQLMDFYRNAIDTMAGRAGTTDGETYAVIRPKYGEKKWVSVKDLDGMTPEEQKAAIKGIGKREIKSTTNMKLYSSPAAAVGAGYLYLKDGNDSAGLSAELAEMGYDEADIATIVADAQAVQQAVADGYSEEEALAYIKGQEKEIDTVSEAPPSDKSVFDYIEEKARAHNKPKTVAFEALVNPEAEMTPEILATKLKVIQPNMASIMTRASSYMGDKLSFNQVELANRQTAQRIVDMFKQRGIDVAWQQTPTEELGFMDHMGGIGQYYVTDAEGNMKPLDDDFWASLKAERAELGWSVAGGLAGGKAGASATAKLTKNPFVVGAGTLAGSLIGAAGGAIIGTEIDYLRESIELSEDISGSIMAHKAMTAAEASVIGDTIGFGIFQGAGTVWRGVKRAKDLVLDGNLEGAMSSLKSSMFVTDSEAKDIVIGLKNVSADDLPKGRKGEIAATLLTKPGSEAIVSAAAAIDPQAAAAVSKAIDTRARDVLQATAALTEENAGRVLVDDLSNYTYAVKKFYGDVKTQVASSPRLNKFKWDYDKLAIDPVLKSLQNNISDPSVLERFVLQSSKIKAMSDSRNLADLLELRQFVNDFKFNKRITKAKDFKALNEVLGRVDKAIDMGAGIVVDKPKEWRQSYTKAKAKYAQMKSLERNVIAKAANRPGMTNETIVKNLTKYITSLDGSFQDVMSALPMSTRPKMEGAVIDALANKFADGLEDGMRVIHYPALSKELDKVSFTTPEARKAKAAIQSMANVFKNDLNLANATGSFQLPRMQSYLTTDPVMRAKYEFASTMFNYAKRLAPTQKSDNLALVMQASKVLENPLNAKSMRELMDNVAGGVNLTKQAMQVQQQAARAASENAVTPKVVFYGEGNMLSVKGNGKGTPIAKHLIATYDIQKQVADTYGIDYNDKKTLAIYLKQDGYTVMQQGSDSVRRIK